LGGQPNAGRGATIKRDPPIAPAREGKFRGKRRTTYDLPENKGERTGMRVWTKNSKTSNAKNKKIKEGRVNWYIAHKTRWEGPLDGRQDMKPQGPIAYKREQSETL